MGQTHIADNLYDVAYRGLLTNQSSGAVYIFRDDPPDVYAVDAIGEIVTILSQGHFETIRTDGAQVDSGIVLSPGQSVSFRLQETRVIDREVANWYGEPRVGVMIAEWNEAAHYRCPSPLQPNP